jgi:beta-phosphoglucomutase-like phosphatase (HAD superfamily)
MPIQCALTSFRELMMSFTPTIKAVIFDLDGTLLDTESLSDQAMFASLLPHIPTHVLEKHRDFRLPWELKRRILGLRSSDWGPIVLAYVQETWGVSKEILPSVEQLACDWENHLNNLCEQVKECPGAFQLIKRFAAVGLPMAIATSSRQTAVERKSRNHLAMFQNISVIVCGDDPAVKKGKPAPDIYVEAARRLGVQPKDCLVFEDALTGLRSARLAGCYVVAIPDTRFDATEMATFTTEAHVVLPDLRHFSGEQFGISIEMVTSQPDSS